jgi:hypothetical protein
LAEPDHSANFAVPIGIPSRQTANAILRQARLPIVMAGLVPGLVPATTHVVVQLYITRLPVDAQMLQTALENI